MPTSLPVPAQFVSFLAFLPSTDMCLVARGGCSHQCTVAPRKGVVCFCPPGLHLDSSNKTCEVVDYCSRHLKCSQVCEQYKTTVKCSCYPGWTLDPDGDSCHSTGSGARLFKCLFNDATGCPAGVWFCVCL